MSNGARSTKYLTFPLVGGAETPPNDERQRQRLEVQQSLQTFLESWLVKYDQYEIKLPPPIRSDVGRIEIDPAQLFPFPDFANELDTLAHDEHGQVRHLDRKQLASVRQHGSFEVDSQLFPGQTHRWKLSRLLQRGYESGRKLFLRGMACALQMLIIYARNRISGRRFSLRDSLRAWRKVPILLIDLLVGFPCRASVPFEQVIEWKREEYLLDELRTSDAAGQLLLTEFASRVRELNTLQRQFSAANLKRRNALLSDWSPLFVYDVPVSSQSVNIILSEGTIWSKMSLILYQIFEAVTTTADDTWFRQLRDATISQLRTDGATKEEMELRVQKAITDEYFNRAYEEISQSQKLSNIDVSLPGQLVSRIKCYRLISDAVDEFSFMYNSAWTLKEQQLIRDYRIRSLIPKWMERQKQAFDALFLKENASKPHEMIRQRLANDDQLKQELYFLERDWTFLLDVEPGYIAELSAITQPQRTFHWEQRLWLKLNYLVARVDHSSDETVLVPTEFLTEPIDHSISAPTNYFHTLTKHVTRTNSSGYVAWRVVNMVKRYWVWTCNYVYWLIYSIPWLSSLGIGALIRPTFFYSGYSVHPVTGVLHPKASSKTHSFLSRIRALWRHIHKARRKFELAEDRGFLSKNVSRIFHKFWNYVVKGAVGTVLLCVTMPVVCVVVSTGSLILGITAPLWMLLFVVGHHLFCAFIFDLDDPRRRGIRYRLLQFLQLFLWRILIRGILQPVAALFTAVLVLPTTSLAIVLFTWLRHGLRAAYDFVMFYAIIKPLSRIPAENTFVAKRIAGPGLSKDYFYEIAVAQALSVIEYQIESDELDAVEREQRLLINQPLVHFKEEVNRTLKPFAAVVNTMHPVCQQLIKETQALEKRLMDELTARRHDRHFQSNMGSVKWSKLRQNRDNLTKTLTAAAVLLEQEYPGRVLSRNEDLERHIWKDRDLDRNDWKGLAAGFFAQWFSADFLIPIEEGDKRFFLEVQHIDTKEYLKQLIDAEHRDDLDDVQPVQVSLDSKVHCFLPRPSPYEYSPSSSPFDNRSASKLPLSSDNGSERLYRLRYVKLPTVAVTMGYVYNNQLASDIDPALDLHYIRNLAFKMSDEL